MALFMNLVLGGQGRRQLPFSVDPHFPGAMTRKGCSDFCYTYLLCVNKCLQFYIKDGISVRASDCIFFTFIDFKTMILYICIGGGAMISFMANSWYC